jgi:glycosyltransferase involved in cell wall biosynthesis
MKIAYLVAGAGGMYCGSCLHGNTLVAALRKLGHDALLLPLYAPLKTDEENESLNRLAFGGINVYLQEHSALFRHTPWFLDRLLDRPNLLRRLAGRSTSVQPDQLGAITVSMLKGELGRQKKEVEKLTAWLLEIQPDIIHLNNVMLIGPAREIRRRLNVPVVCSLSGEDIFLEKIVEPHYSAARKLLAERAAELDGFTAMNRYYADFMAEYLAVSRDAIQVIPPGLNPEGFAKKQVYRSEKDAPCTLGFFARICPEKGLHQLIEAFILLAKDNDLPPIRLRAAGYFDKAEQGYLDGIFHRLREEGLADRFEYLGELDRKAKIAFLHSLDILSVPTTYRESKGLSILEGFMVGLPAVLPRHGAFPEILETTGGGLLFEPKNIPSLAENLKKMILDPHFAQVAGRQAQQIAEKLYNAKRMAEDVLQWYGEKVEGMTNHE